MTVALALTTEASADQAEALARALLERRLVACVSLGPVRCHF
ncbi:MAG: divalent cation tolerance protein CutA [Microcystis sp.]